MAGKLKVRRWTTGDTLEFHALTRPLERLRGLLLTGPDADPIALVGCSSIHTWGMRYQLDVAFVGSSGLVLDVRRGVPPGKLVGCRRAWVTFERPHGCGDWFLRGERVSLMMTGGDGDGGKTSVPGQDEDGACRPTFGLC